MDFLSLLTSGHSDQGPLPTRSRNEHNSTTDILEEQEKGISNARIYDSSQRLLTSWRQVVSLLFLAQKRTQIILVFSVFWVFFWVFFLMARHEFSEPKPQELPQSTAVIIVDTVPESSLSKLCKETKWTDGLWLHCHNHALKIGDNGGSFSGGLTNARNRFQTCVRLAIDLGAGVLIPSITARAEDNLGLANTHVICPDLWFDIEYFRSEVQQQCPQLQMKFCQNSMDGATVVNMPYRPTHEDPSHTKTTFGCTVNTELLRRDIKREEIDPMKPVLVNYGDAMFTWNYTRCDENPTIRKDLIKTIRNSPSLVNMGLEILSHPELDEKPFFGVHLRAEKDVPASWGPVDVQMQRFVESILATSAESEEAVSTVYVSCGDQDAIETFRQLLRPHGFSVIDKWSLLKEDTERLEILNSFNFDQKGAVDSEVLRSSTYFLGHWKSTMSLQLVYERVMDDDPQKWFRENIYPESTDPATCCHRKWVHNLVVSGDTFQKLYIIDGPDFMDTFP
ncbi:uncharacterized protein LY89DRAFT_331873 [Mollisia scopiformis]|uniref:O-fucosyltransferase family protein n=1 Tax=Mollisia scopiformis TaxID=149040 RepID=A0A132B7W5_MOLSC|nr:uncharacterized protein LY89DRAFT_331873 [Mollisia scopiformis]KUJ08492.1 hypothetical protein LY89DRAFT_331873 [Mollisia scopiformis]